MLAPSIATTFAPAVYRQSGRRHQPHESLQGHLFKLISSLMFAGDVGAGALSRRRVPVGQVVFFRAAFAILPVVFIYAVRGELGGGAHRAGRSAMLGRGMFSVGGMFLNFASLARLPLVGCDRDLVRLAADHGGACRRSS